MLLQSTPEELLQKKEGTIELLPALPRQWSSGEARGLRARGGYTVDIRWGEDVGKGDRGEVTATITAMKKGKVRVCCGGASRLLKLKAGETREVTLNVPSF